MDRLTIRYLRTTFAFFVVGMMTVTNAADRPSLSSLRIIDAPGALSTSTNAINDREMIVGAYLSEGSSARTAFMQIGRFFTAINHPDTAPGFPTIPWEVNNRGEIVGLFFGIDGNFRAFLLSRGEFTTISIPNALTSAAHGINNQGKVVGSFTDFSLSTRGFLFDGSAVTIIDVPNSNGTEPLGINDKNQIVGTFCTLRDCIIQNLGSHGFLLSEGVYRTIDVPNSASTSITAINNLGQIVGSYRVGAVDHGFLLYRGKFTTVDVEIPNAGGFFPRIDGINDRGQITGSYFDFAALKSRGFVADIREFTD
jgi:probable HAF family extracellular repeat protein